MRYFDYLTEREKAIFYKLPQYFDKSCNIEKLKYVVGALLYVPAINKDMLYKIADRKIRGIVSMAICLEDAIGIEGEAESINNVKEILEYLKLKKNTKDELPLLFIRFRNIEQMLRCAEILKENLNVLTGIIVPKANSNVIREFLKYLNTLNCESLYLMPIIETTEFINIETKNKAFVELYKVIIENKNRILNIRTGVTDILGSYGVRRNKNMTIYDNIVFNKFCSDLMGTIGGNVQIDIPISGGVSEFYDLNNEEILETYLKEIDLDKLNGLFGKTVIHPFQLKVVQAKNIINYEDYFDAKSIIENVNSKYGVSASFSFERMNEVNPHLKWAKKIMILSEIYGVIKEGVTINEVLKF